MPIRFRCAYCNQLMAIARRKAGTVVRCPTCAGQVIVPDPGQVEAAPENASGPLRGIEDFGQPREETSRGAPPPARPPGRRVQTEPFALSEEEDAPAGIFLSGGKVVFLTLLMLTLLGLAFAAGYFLRDWR